MASSSSSPSSVPSPISNADGGQRAKKTPFWVTFTAGGIAGTVGAVITCPLEVVKTRLQSSKFAASAVASPPHLQMAATGNGPIGNPLVQLARPFRSAAFHVGGTVSVLRGVALQEGIGALWKGVGATIVGVVPARAIYFSCYHRGKHWLADSLGRADSDPLVHLAAAATAGIVTATATNPIWLIKTRMQLQSTRADKGLSAPIYRNSIDCVRRVLREEGVSGMYKGLAASYIGVAESTLQWVIYEHLKKRIAARSLRQHHQQADSTTAWGEYFAAAAGAKLVAAVLMYPHEVLRTRMRERGGAKYCSVGQTVRVILQEEGVRALYGGMTAHLMRVVPNAAIMFFCYEFLVHSYDRLAQS